MRKKILTTVLAGISGLLVNMPATALTNTLQQGIQFGDLNGGNVVVWSRSNNVPARMMIQYALNPQFTGAKTLRGPYALPNTDFTAQQEIINLPLGVEVYVKVWFEDLSNARNKSSVETGHFRTVAKTGNIRFLWSGDTAGQGWGINSNPAFGGMKIYEAMRQANPHFFIHSGDTIYADDPIPPYKKAENNRFWFNVVQYGVEKVAETQEEFRGRYKYNLLDTNVRRFNAEVPQIWQWDDHEVVNNWSNSKDLTNDTRYRVKAVPLLTARAVTAFNEYSPRRTSRSIEAGRIYRKIAVNPLLDVFVVDMRSYRGANGLNMETTESASTAFLGNGQVAWLLRSLKESTAVWKVIAADQPLSVNINNVFPTPAGQQPTWEAVANGDNGVARGRELEIARLLKGIKQANVKNIVWLTADVHYAAAHYYDPAKAATKDFSPFWEFVAGPLNAGTYGGYTMDQTFGVQVKARKWPENTFSLSPYGGMQFFGEVNVNSSTKNMLVRIKNQDGVVVISQPIVHQ